MRILHAPYEVAGQIGLSVHGLRAIGHTARGFFQPHRFEYAHGPDMFFRSEGLWPRRLETASYLVRFALQYDVFHYHFGRSLLPGSRTGADARLFGKLGRKVVVAFWGSDIRMPSVASRNNPYYVNTRGNDDAEAREKMRLWAEITHGHVICADPTLWPGLKESFDHIHLVSALVNTDRLQPHYPSPEQKIPVVFHAPSHAPTKGTHFVRTAVELLKSKGLQFEYVEAQGVTQKQALELCARADLVVDQLGLGHYGTFSAEAMALGKPVICYVLPEAVAAYPEGFPVINANPDTLADVLEEWLFRPEDRYRLGRVSREYAERVYDYRVGAKRLLEIYERLPVR